MGFPIDYQDVLCFLEFLSLFLRSCHSKPGLNVANSGDPYLIPLIYDDCQVLARSDDRRVGKDAALSPRSSSQFLFSKSKPKHPGVALAKPRVVASISFLSTRIEGISG